MKVKVKRWRQGIWSCPECYFFWYWKMDRDSKFFDRKCPFCHNRVRSVMERQPGNRGRPRQFFLETRPSHMPRAAITRELINRNEVIKRKKDREAEYIQMGLETWGWEEHE